MRFCYAVAPVLAACLAFAQPAQAQFSTRDGYAPDGTYKVSVELTPYLFLPNLDATVGMNRPASVPGGGGTTSYNVFRDAHTVASHLRENLIAGFLGYGLVRYGPFSLEANTQYISGQRTTPINTPLPNLPVVNMVTRTSFMAVSPGLGYQVWPQDANSQIGVDVRAGAAVYQVWSTVGLGNLADAQASSSPGYVQPWAGARITYVPFPDWRITADAAMTGMGAAGGAWGWNGRINVSYLISDHRLAGYQPRLCLLQQRTQHVSRPLWRGAQCQPDHLWADLGAGLPVLIREQA